MSRFTIEYVDSSMVQVLVEGRVKLTFQVMADGRLWKTGAEACDRKAPIVSRQDFLGALRKAGEAIESAQKFEGISNRDIAERVLQDVARNHISVETAVDSFLQTADWCSPSRRGDIMHEIGLIGGKASHEKAMQRLTATRQGDLFLKGDSE